MSGICACVYTVSSISEILAFDTLGCSLNVEWSQLAVPLDATEPTLRDEGDYSVDSFPGTHGSYPSPSILSFYFVLVLLAVLSRNAKLNKSKRLLLFV